MARLDDAIRQVNASGDTCYLPELLRVKAGLQLSTARQRVDDAETCLIKSLELSRSQGAVGWELRAANDMAALLAEKGLRERGKAVVDNVLRQFTEGFDTADLQAAKRLSEQLS
jgi:hypothetical protein